MTLQTNYFLPMVGIILDTLDTTINQFFSSHFAKYSTDVFLLPISGECCALGSQLN